MADGATTTPDSVLVRLDGRVARLTPDTLPGWWRIDPETCVRRADAIEIRAAALAAAVHGGVARLLAVLRAATLNGVPTPFSDAVMLALALGDTQESLADGRADPENGWTRVRFGVAAGPSAIAAIPSGEDFSGLIEALAERLISLDISADAAPEAPSARTPPFAPAVEFDLQVPASGLPRDARSPAPADRAFAPAGGSLPERPSVRSEPRLHSKAVSADRAARESGSHAALRHRRLPERPAPKAPAGDDAAMSAPRALRLPAARTAQQTSVSDAGAADFAAATFLPAQTAAQSMPSIEHAGAHFSSRRQPSDGMADRPTSWAPVAPPLTGRSAAPLTGFAALPPAVSATAPAVARPIQTASVSLPVLAGSPFSGSAALSADALLAALARTLEDECDHRGLDR